MRFFEGQEANNLLHFAACASDIVAAVEAGMRTPEEDTVNIDAMRAALPEPHECHTYAAIVMLVRFLKRGGISVEEWTARGPDTATEVALTESSCVPPQG